MSDSAPSAPGAQNPANDLKKKQKAEEKALKVAKAAAKKEQQQQQQKQQQEKKEAKDGAASEQPKKTKEKTLRLKEEFVNTTPKGEKKDMSAPMASEYNPPAVEAAWYDWWLAKGYFGPEINKDAKESFVMVIPPPNVTGALHLGHALTNSVQDSIVRWNRMSGKRTLWVPGTDHAGIATQTQVEKNIAKESGLTRNDLGREAFVEKVWEWRNQYGHKIINQIKRLGSSVDWDREYFSMDDQCSAAVKEAFVRLYREGLIYRDTRLVNWCCKLKTAISDVEVEHIQLEGPTYLSVPGETKTYQFGVLVHFVYKVADSDDEIEIGTTRIETMLADTAVAVHPEDPRYKHLHGKFVQHPFFDRKIPIILDSELVDMSFGTGAVKVTPAHDPNDFKCGKRHNLNFITFLNDDGTLNHNGGPFQGMTRFQARAAVLESIKEKGLFRKTVPNPMAIATCSRSRDIIEPMIKPQWWVDCQSGAKEAIEAVRNGSLEFTPPHHKDTWYRWLENIQDWCISRQLWWGHRIPVYRVSIKGNPLDDVRDSWVCAYTQEEALSQAVQSFKDRYDQADISVVQDPDVLDTWFSAALFPFSVFGWPNVTEDLKTFYPTTLLETGHDIIFFWVARMVMMGLKLTKQLPFKQVMFHAMVRDAHGRKMSKSKGNVIDPIDVIEGITLEGLHESLVNGLLDPKEIEIAKQGQKKDFPKGISECGTDAMRFALCAYTSQGRDINLNINRVEAYRNFCNKLWNATRFALSNLGTDFVPKPNTNLSGTETKVDKWILSILNDTITQVNEGFKAYDLSLATTSAYNFWLYNLCDVYLEAIKPTMNADVSVPENAQKKRTSQDVLYTCLETGLKLLHPFMPFVTEELFHRLPQRPGSKIESISIASFPQLVNEWDNKPIEAEVKRVQEVIHAARSLRSQYTLTTRVPVYARVNSESTLELLRNYSDLIKVLAFASEVQIIDKTSATPEGSAVYIVDEMIEVFIVVRGAIDFIAEVQKLEKKNVKLIGDMQTLIKKMSVADYDKKVPENVRKQNSEKQVALQQEIETTISAIENFKKLGGI